MLTDDFQKNIAILREKYTFSEDKEMTFLWEKKVRELTLIKNLKELDGIKQFLAELETMIKEMSTLLSWSKEMTEEERQKVFVRREVYLWVYSFFKDPEEIINSIMKRVEDELKD